MTKASILRLFADSAFGSHVPGVGFMGLRGTQAPTSNSALLEIASSTKFSACLCGCLNTLLCFSGIVVSVISEVQGGNLGSAVKLQLETFPTGNEERLHKRHKMKSAASSFVQDGGSRVTSWSPSSLDPSETLTRILQNDGDT